MNREMYDELCSSEVGFPESRWVREVDTRLIKLDSHNSQIRKNGAVVQKVPGMVTDIESNGQLVPADVKELADGTYELKDGITRYLAQKQRGAKLKVSTWHDDKFTTHDEWSLHQAKCNDHEVSTPNTKEDIKYQVKKFLSSGTLERKLGYRQRDKPEAFLKNAPVFLKEEIYKRSGVPVSTIRSWLKGFINKSAPLTSRYENYTKPTAWEFFSAHNQLGWTGDKAGEICNNVCIYALPDAGDAKDLYGNVWRKTEKNPDVDVYVLIWVNSLADKDDAGLKKAREKLLDLYSTGQNHPRFKKPMFKGVYVLPQIKSGDEKENMKKLYLPAEMSLTNA